VECIRCSSRRLVAGSFLALNGVLGRSRCTGDPLLPKPDQVGASSRAYGRTRSSEGSSFDRERLRHTAACRPYWHANGTSRRSGCKPAMVRLAGARQSGDHGEVADARPVLATAAAVRRRCVPWSARLPVPPGRGRWGRGPRRPQARGAPASDLGTVGGHLSRWQPPRKRLLPWWAARIGRCQHVVGSCEHRPPGGRTGGSVGQPLKRGPVSGLFES
jgi:hypothetical protein